MTDDDKPVNKFLLTSQNHLYQCAGWAHTSRTRKLATEPQTWFIRFSDQQSLNRPVKHTVVVLTDRRQGVEAQRGGRSMRGLTRTAEHDRPANAST